MSFFNVVHKQLVRTIKPSKNVGGPGHSPCETLSHTGDNGLLFSGPKSSFQLKAFFHWIQKSRSQSRDTWSLSYLRSIVRFLLSVMVWGSLSCAGVYTLCFIRSKVSAAVFQEILKHFMLPFADQYHVEMQIFFSSRTLYHPTLPEIPIPVGTKDHGITEFEVSEYTAHDTPQDLDPEFYLKRKTPLQKHSSGDFFLCAKSVLPSHCSFLFFVTCRR